MDRPRLSRALKSFPREKFLRGLFLYVLPPVLLLLVLAEPLRESVRAGASAPGILLAALGLVCLNGLVYRLLRRKGPTLLVLAHGTLCLTAVAVLLHGAVPTDSILATVMATVWVSLGMASLLLLSFWLAEFRTRKPLLALSVTLRVILGLILALMVYQVARDIETKLANLNTWITLAVFLAFLAAFNGRRIWLSRRRKKSQQKRTGLAEGRIVQMVGESYLDMDDDTATRYLARVKYTVDGVPYETKASIRGITLRRYGRRSFVGRPVPVTYDPENPADAFVKQIDKHIFDVPSPSEDPEEEENDPETHLPAES